MSEARQGLRRDDTNTILSWWQRVATLRAEVERPGITLEARVRVLGSLGEALGRNPSHLDEAVYVLRESVIMAEMMGSHGLAAANRLRLATALEATGDMKAAALELERAESTIRAYNLRSTNRARAQLH